MVRSRANNESSLGYPTETSTLLPTSSKVTSRPKMKKTKNKTKTTEKSSEDRASKENSKLGTFDGVFLPTTLNVLSILMFLRFGFIIGQMGILGTFLLLLLSYFIDILTTMSISAISTNGTVKGGGAYYMISRSLGPEFGGAIGLVFFIGQILNSALNVVGFIEPLLLNFNEADGTILKMLPIGYTWQILYSTLLLALCTGVALVGSKLVSKTGFLLFIILTISTLSVPFSTLFVKPFHPLQPPLDDLVYTGLSWSTFKGNLLPHFTSGAAGSVQPPGEPETFKNLFGIFFPATAGIFAGASMSGELKNPSKSIPEGTLKGLMVSFILYSMVIVAMGAAIPRDLLHNSVEVIQVVNLSGFLILLGEFSTSLFSAIMGIVGSASMLSAIADDKIIPGLSFFTTTKKNKSKGPTNAILITWFIAQVFLFADINQIATFITMAFLMTFIVTNLACFLLRVGSAPNFRPSFKYFSSRTAFTGGVSSIIAMYIVDGISATSVIVFLIILIMLIHYLAPPSKFGDISQLLIYHQVRKYLLRLKLQMSVKYWRPQILLLCDDPRSSWNLIGFCNHLKKGGLYILGHVVLMNDDTANRDPRLSEPLNQLEFNVDSYKEILKQRQAWVKLRDLSKIKAFVQIALGPTLPWGVRNVYLGSGLGGMKPNITVLGFYDFVKHGVDFPVVPSFEKDNKMFQLPTDDCRREKKISINQWVQIVEDLIIMQATVAVAANFSNLNLPKNGHTHHHFWSKPKITDSAKRFIDLYPIQMSSINILEDGKSVLSTNFDTYTLILQLGAILATVPEWKFSSHVLRVIVFVESQDEVEDEKNRLANLLSSLRIDAQTIVVCLDDGNLDTYNFVVKGYHVTPTNKLKFDKIDRMLKNDQWWKNLCNARTTLKDLEKQRVARRKQSLRFQQQIPVNHSKSSLSSSANLSDGSNSNLKLQSLNLNSSKNPVHESNLSYDDIKGNRRYTISNLHGQGLSLSFNMKTQQGNDFFKYDDSNSDSSSGSSDSEKEDYMESSGNLDEYGSTSNLNKRISKGSPSPALSGNSNPKTSSESNNKIYSLGDHFLAKEKAQGDRNNSSDQISIRSSRSNLKPHFSSVKTPQAQLNVGEDEEDEEVGKQKIGFVNDDQSTDDEDDGDDAMEENQNELEDVGRAKKENGVTTDLNKNVSTSSDKAKRGYFDLVKPAEEKSRKLQLKKPPTSSPSIRSPSIISNNDEIIQHMRTPKFLAADDDDDENLDMNISQLNLSKSSETNYGSNNRSQPSGASNLRSDFYNGRQKPNDTSKDNSAPFTRKHLQEELRSLTFNDLPAKGQHIILNELMRKVSDKESTDVIFSTLPAPSLGTHLSYDDSFDYTHNIALWLNELPPVMLLNSQTVTVTTAL